MKEHVKALQVFRMIVGILGFIGGLVLGRVLTLAILEVLDRPANQVSLIGVPVVLALVIALITFIIAKPLWKGIVVSTSWLENRLKNMPLADLVAATLGLIIGLIVAFLLSAPLTSLPFVGPYVQLLASLILGYLGMAVGYRWGDRLSQVVDSLVDIRREKDRERGVDRRQKEDRVLSEPSLISPQETYRARPKILDTSVIIDGRIVEVCKAGFIEGPLVIAGFVLNELRHIADSSDSLKRNRGRRGLDMLNELRDLALPVEISRMDYDDIAEVDAKLVRLAKDVNGTVVTNDFNLNKVAAFSQVPVLNINELAGAIKAVVLPGEDMVVEIVGKGKEVGQGIAYLDDGTMIVVENGADAVGKTLEATVTSVIQTNAGRMIFVRLK